MRHIHLILLFTVIAMMTACVEEPITTDPSAQLEFSGDTLWFDTVFNGIPSRTGRIRVYNRNKKALRISSIFLGKGSASNFRFNFDGHIPSESNSLVDMVINSKDSLSVFIEVTAPQDESNENILTFDSLLFECNGVIKDVKLIAPSKNAVILDNYTLEQSTEFDSVRPYLIFGDLHVPENIKLTIKEGVTLYFHSGANLRVEGELSCEGTLRSPVTMRGDRFDAIEDELSTPYDYMPGQWGSVYLYSSDVKHKFNHTVIRGGTMGIVLYGTSRVNPSVSVENSVIHSMSDFGLYSINGNITIVNTEISNCGTSCLYMIGGQLKMAHCTVANYYAYGMRTNSAVVISNIGYADGETLSLPVTSATIENSILFGNYSKELTLSNDSVHAAAFNVSVRNSLIKSKLIDSPIFANITWSKAMNDEGIDVVFARTAYDADGYYDFTLDSLSMARNNVKIASKEVALFYPLDMKEVSRTDDDGPDLGAYERR